MSNKSYKFYGIISILIGFLMMRGTLQKIITFDSVSSELGFTFLAFLLGAGCLICGFSKETETETINN